MYIIVIGLGEVGRHLLSQLDQEGHDVVAIDKNASAVAYAEDHYDVMSLVGYGASHDVLEQAGVRRADLVVAVSEDDEVNLIAALAAKQLGAKRVIARVQGNEWSKWTDGVKYGLLGVDVVINPRILVAQELSRIARSHGANDVIDLAQDRLELVQLQVTDSRLTERPLASLDLPAATLVAGVVRNQELFIPGGADVLLPDDRVYLIGTPDGVQRTEEYFNKQRQARKICIVGGGVVGATLARELVRQDARVLVIERDRESAERLGADLIGVDVIHGEGTDQSLLEEEEIGSFDFFVATTRQDEINLMASLLAKRVGVPRTACIVQRADYSPIYRQLGIDAVLSPRAVASDHIVRYTRSGEILSLVSIEDGAAEVLELTAQPGCRAAGKAIRRMDLPRGALIAAIVRGEDIVIPRGDDQVQAGDRVIVMTVRAARSSVEQQFRAGRF